MKKLLLPVIIAVLAGIGGGSGFAYMRVSKSYVADSTARADSLKAHPPVAKDSTTKEAGAGEASEHVAAAESASKAEPLPLTPADSIRAVEASRAALRATGANPSSVPPAHGDAKSDAHAKADSAKSATAGKAATPKSAPPTPATAAVANVVRDARNAALNTDLKEERLAKIFSAMAPKDAAKVMDQMPDADVRAIIALMSDRNAAAILPLFKAERAAALTKSAAKAPTTP